MSNRTALLTLAAAFLAAATTIPAFARGQDEPREQDPELAIVIGAQGNAALHSIRAELAPQPRAPVMPARPVDASARVPAGSSVPASARLGE